MDSYDNDTLLLMLDDDLFPIKESEAEKCGENSTITPYPVVLATAQSER